MLRLLLPLSVCCMWHVVCCKWHIEVPTSIVGEHLRFLGSPAPFAKATNSARPSLSISLSEGEYTCGRMVRGGPNRR